MTTHFALAFGVRVFPRSPVVVNGSVAAQFFRKWLKRSLELKSQEEDLHAQMPLHLRRVLKGKKLLLWKEILVDLQYKDAGVIDDVIKGFSLTGWAPKTGVFEPWVRKPEYSLDHLLKLAPALNAAVTGALTSATDGEHDQFVWDETQKEVEQGWLYPADHCKPECIAKRFPLQQANKVRLMDDFSINGVNAAYGLSEKLRVQSIDQLCSYLAYILDHCNDPVALELVGRTFDFKQAYRQCGVDPYHHELLKIAVRKPGGSYKLFRVGALPFGAVGSVTYTAFLRISNCISFIASKALHLVLTAFFDDFTVVCSKPETTNATFCMEALFRMLGIWFADPGDKAPPFNVIFKTLGLLISFEQLEAGFKAALSKRLTGLGGVFLSHPGPFLSHRRNFRRSLSSLVPCKNPSNLKFETFNRSLAACFGSRLLGTICDHY